MKNVMYKQCRMEKREGETRHERVSWIPERYAVEGTTVRLRDGDTWSAGWTVVSASGPALDEKYVVNMSHAHTRQRKASDI